MKAVILAAGLGTRLRPITYFVPKPMIPINGRPILAYLVDHLYRFRISQIIVNLHYKPNKIMNYFGTRLLYFYEPNLLGEEGTLEALKSWMDDYTVVMNGDTLTNVNLIDMFDVSKGNNIRLMDTKNKSLYAGTRIIKPYYQKGKEVYYQDSNSKWLDIGTYSNLAKAPKFLQEIKEPDLRN